jgi:hypothetical protein
MGAIPELISSRDASFCGTREKLGKRKWPFVSKKAKNISRNSFSPNFFISSKPSWNYNLECYLMYHILSLCQVKRKNGSAPDSAKSNDMTQPEDGN